MPIETSDCLQQFGWDDFDPARTAGLKMWRESGAGVSARTSIQSALVSLTGFASSSPRRPCASSAASATGVVSCFLRLMVIRSSDCSNEIGGVSSPPPIAPGESNHSSHCFLPTRRMKSRRLIFAPRQPSGRIARYRIGGSQVRGIRAFSQPAIRPKLAGEYVLVAELLVACDPAGKRWPCRASRLRYRWREGFCPRQAVRRSIWRPESYNRTDGRAAAANSTGRGRDASYLAPPAVG
jgi:hypothetical protein